MSMEEVEEEEEEETRISIKMKAKETNRKEGLINRGLLKKNILSTLIQTIKSSTLNSIIST
jgi:hypothetical protein